MIYFNELRTYAVSEKRGVFEIPAPHLITQMTRPYYAHKAGLIVSVQRRRIS